MVPSMQHLPSEIILGVLTLMAIKGHCHFFLMGLIAIAYNQVYSQNLSKLACKLDFKLPLYLFIECEF